MCFEICRSSSKPQADNTTCLQKTLSKEALFAVALLLGSGAVLSYFTRLGNPLTVSLGLTGGGCASASLIACAKSSSKKPQVLQPDSSIVSSDNTTETDTLFVQLSDRELVEKLTPPYDPQIKGALSSRLKDLLQANAKKEPAEVALALQPFFSAAGDDLTKFQELVRILTTGPYLFPHDFHKSCTPRVLADSLELICQGNNQKNKIVIVELNLFLYNTGCVTISWTSSEDGIKDIFMNAKNIFGDEDFNLKSTKPMSNTLAKAIGFSIFALAYTWQKQGKETQDKVKPIRVGFHQSFAGRFPASIVVPILPYLKSFPGMVELTFSDIGGDQGYYVSESSSQVNNSFRDEDAEILLDLIKSNPYLKKVDICVVDMSEAKRTSFMQEMQSILEYHSQHPPSSPPASIWRVYSRQN